MGLRPLSLQSPSGPAVAPLSCSMGYADPAEVPEDPVERARCVLAAGRPLVFAVPPLAAAPLQTTAWLADARPGPMQLDVLPAWLH